MSSSVLTAKPRIAQGFRRKGTLKLGAGLARRSLLLAKTGAWLEAKVIKKAPVGQDRGFKEVRMVWFVKRLPALTDVLLISKGYAKKAFYEKALKTAYFLTGLSLCKGHV